MKTIAEPERMLFVLDAFMAGETISQKERDLHYALARAGCFAAAAYEAAPAGGADVHALTRAFLLALVDATHPDLDYLRAEPTAGAIARDTSGKLTSLTQRRKP